MTAPRHYIRIDYYIYINVYFLCIIDYISYFCKRYESD